MSYFAVCDSCGCIEWYEYFGKEIKLNYLNKDGEIYIAQELMPESIYNPEIFGEINVTCYDCEKGLTLISTWNISQELRKEIYSMTSEERINWVNGYWLAQKLKEDVH